MDTSYLETKDKTKFWQLHSIAHTRRDTRTSINSTIDGGSSRRITQFSVESSRRKESADDSHLTARTDTSSEDLRFLTLCPHAASSRRRDTVSAKGTAALRVAAGTRIASVSPTAN